VESDSVADLLRAAYKERQRLEALLRSNPDFQKLQGVRRIIALYDHEGQGSSPGDPIPRPDQRGSTSHPAAASDHRAEISRPVIRPEPSVRVARPRWTKGNSQSAKIRAATADYLRQKGKRATGGEIYKAITAQGIKVGGKDPAAGVTARISAASAIFDHTPEGYGLREWSNGGSPQTAAANPVLWADPGAGISRPTPSSDQRTTVSRPVARSDQPDRTSGRGGWTWANSKTSRIRAAPEDYLRATGRRARGGEIYRAIASKVEIKAKKPAALVSARLTSSALFDRTREGYGLREWSDGAAANKNGPSTE
jgi:hypothetical protein